MDIVKLFLILCSVSALSLFFILKSTDLSENYHYYWNQNCFVPLSEDIQPLEDIDEATIYPDISQSDHQIFFLETSCSNKNGGVIHLTARQICAIESMARLHPNHKIFVVFTAPVGLQRNGFETEILQKLLQYENVYLRYVNLSKYAVDTPLEEFFAKQVYRTSRYFNTHLSDILRFLTLFKYGGLYLDTDIVGLRSFESLGTNFVAAKSHNSIGSSVINFGNDELGRLVVFECIKEVISTFDGSKWAHNGPGVLTRVLSRLCETNMTALMSKEACFGFQVLPIETFAPVQWTSNKFYFQEGYTTDVMKLTEKAYIIHLFNHLNKDIPVEKKSKVAYALIAKEHCPDMFNATNTVF